MRYEIKKQDHTLLARIFVQNRFRPVTLIVIQGWYGNITTPLLLIPHQETLPTNRKEKEQEKIPSKTFQMSVETIM